MSVVQGKNLLVYLQGTGDIGDTDTVYPIGCDKDCTLVIDIGMMEVVAPENGNYRAVLPTLVGYQITGSGLVDYTKQMGAQSLQALAKARRLVVFKFKAVVSENQSVIYSGQGYFKNVTLSGPVTGGATYSYVLIPTLDIDINNTVPVSGSGTPADDMAQTYKLPFTATTGQKTYQNDELIGATIIDFIMEGLSINEGSLDDEFTGLDSSTGILTWNFPVLNGNRAIIIYKK